MLKRPLETDVPKGHRMASGVSRRAIKNNKCMALFDQDFFDSGVRFDEAVPGRTTMNKIIVKQDLKNKSDTEVKQYSQNYMDKLAKTTVFPTLTAGATAYLAVHNAFSTALGNSNQANETAKQMTILKDTARAALEVALTQNGHTVESTPNVTADMAMSVGFDTRGGAAPVGPLPQVANLSVSIGDHPGEVDAHWDAIYGKSNYEYAQCTGDPAVEANWTLLGSCSASKITLKNLASGTRVWVRARAKARKGENDGAWSQPATIIVP